MSLPRAKSKPKEGVLSRQNRCAIYVRKSRKDRNKEAHRLAVQREQLPAHAQSQGWHPSVYDDGFASGADQTKLPHLQRLMDAIRRGEIDVVLTIELSRLSRDDSSVQYLQFLDLCRSHEVKLATPGQILDPADPSQWLILMMHGGISSVEMQQLKLRMAEGRARAKAVGQFMGGTPPWPYKATGNRTITVSPEDKEKARGVLQRLQHASVWEVSRRVPELSPATLARMTTRSRLLYFAAKRELDDCTIIDCQWEPIITEQEMVTLRKASSGRLPYRRSGREPPTRLLNGLGIFMCAYCDRTIKGHSDKKTYKRSGRTETHHYYRCNRYKIRVGLRTECKNQSLVKCAVVDDPLLLHVQHTLDRVAEIKEAFEQAVREESGNHEADALRRRLYKAELRRDRLVDSIASGTLTEAEARSHLQRVRDEIAELQVQFEQVDSDTPEQLEELGDFQGINLEEYSLEEKRELLRIVVKDIRLRFDRLFITYNLYEAPGKLYVGRVDLQRNPAHNSKLRRK